MIAALEWELPEEKKTRLSHQPRLQRAIIADGHILMVLHKPPRPGKSTCEAVTFWRKPSGNWQCSEGCAALAELEQLVNDYDTAIAQIEEEWERSVDPHTPLKPPSQIGRFWRASVSLRDALQEATNAISESEERLDFQGLCDRMNDIAWTSEILRTEAMNALRVYFTKQREVQANRSPACIASVSCKMGPLASPRSPA